MLCAIVVMGLVFFAGLRYETGSDWAEYTRRFSEIHPIEDWFDSGPLQFEFEVGFELMCAVIKSFGGTVQTLLFIVPLFNIVLTYLVLRRYSPFILISIFIFYCTLFINFNFAVLRQAMAFPIFFYSLRYLFSRSAFPFFGSMILAGLFHYSVLPLMILYAFPFEKQLARKWAIIIFCGGIVCMQVISIKTVVNLGMTFGVFPPYINDKLMNYMMDAGFGASRGLTVGFFLKVGIFIFALWKREMLRARVPVYDFFFNLYLFYCVFWMALNDFDVVLLRYSLYFQIIQDLLLVFIILAFKELVFKLLYYVLFIVTINGYFFSALFRSYADIYIPYKSVINKRF